MLLGTPNYDDLVYNKIKLDTTNAAGKSSSWF